MILFPAIDLFGGKAVRLYQGDYAKMTVYADDPLLPARDFVSRGADHIHLVDLEGARDGGTPNFDAVCRIKAECGAFCEVGGGIRSLDTASRYLDAGVDRVILGTAAVTDEAFLSAAIERYGDRIAVGADLRDGCVAIRGWRETSPLTVGAFCERMIALGVSTLICTDISRDGAMRGVNLPLYRTLSALPLRIVASGGVSSHSDLAELKAAGVWGAIVGKAYYTGAIDLARAIREAL